MSKRRQFLQSEGISRVVGFLRQAKSFLPLASSITRRELFIQVFLSPTFDTVVLSGVVLNLQKSKTCKSSEIIVLLASLQVAAWIPQVDHLLQSWAGWSSNHSMIWLPLPE